MMASLARRPATWAWATALWLAILAGPAEDSPDRHLGAPMFELGGEHFLSGLYPRRGSGLHDMPLVKRLARELSRFILRPEILDGPSRFSRRCTGTGRGPYITYHGLSLIMGMPAFYAEHPAGAALRVLPEVWIPDQRLVETRRSMWRLRRLRRGRRWSAYPTQR